MLKGPTGCGTLGWLSTWLTSSGCHSLLSVVRGHDLVGSLGPLRAPRVEHRVGGRSLDAGGAPGGICYLDEVVEARQDAIVAVHSLADHRRELNIERLGGLKLQAAEGF